uniref:Putative secreted protein n=1 Tax=Amblyomma americanum TaxID=6943 RepID=A0A0C9SET5_AMBAM
MQIGVVTGLLRGLGPTLAAAEVAAAAEAAAQVAACYQPAEHKQCLAPATGEHEVGVDVFLAKLLSHVQTQGAIVVIDVALGQVREDRVRPVDVLKFICCFWVVWILVRVIFEG